MHLDLASHASRTAAGRIVVVLAAGLLGGCQPHGAGSLSLQAAPDSVRDTWAASDKTVFNHLCKPNLSVPGVGGSFSISELGKCDVSKRHGAWDKRRLSRYDAMNHVVISDGPIATITMVAGTEDRIDTDFNSPLPIAIIDLPAGSPDYQKLGLKAGRNYWIVQKLDSGWVSWTQAVGPAGPTPAAVPLGTFTSHDYDSQQPTFSAQFVWEDNDESLWAYCSGKCCKASGAL